MTTAAELLIWGLLVHLVVDWLGQNEWMSVNKASRRPRATRPGDGRITPPRMYMPPTRWWDRHPAAYVHGGLHGAAQLLVFPWWAALAIGVTHLLIDTRVPVAWWSRLIRQTQPLRHMAYVERRGAPAENTLAPLYDIGTEVRIWADQVWHFAVVGLVALAVAA